MRVCQHHKTLLSPNHRSADRNIPAWKHIAVAGRFDIVGNSKTDIVEGLGVTVAGRFDIVGNSKTDIVEVLVKSSSEMIHPFANPPASQNSTLAKLPSDRPKLLPWKPVWKHISHSTHRKELPRRIAVKTHLCTRRHRAMANPSSRRQAAWSNTSSTKGSSR